MKIIFLLFALLSLTANATDEQPACELALTPDQDLMELMRLTIERLENTEESEAAEMGEEERARLEEVLFAGEKKPKKLSKDQKRAILKAKIAKEEALLEKESEEGEERTHKPTLREQRNALRNSHRKVLKAEEKLNNARNTRHMGKLRNLADDYLDALDRKNDLLQEIKSQRANVQR